MIGVFDQLELWLLFSNRLSFTDRAISLLEQACRWHECPGLHQLLLLPLQAVVERCQENSSQSSPYLPRATAPVPIPELVHLSLKRIREQPNLASYTTAIALRLAKPWQAKALELASQFATELTNLTTTQTTLISETQTEDGWNLWKAFQIEVTPPGWIVFRLTEQGLSQWLQYLTQIPTYKLSGLPIGSSLITSEELFSVQATHARCCSLLRLNQHEGILTCPVSNLEEPKADSPMLWSILNRQDQPVRTALRYLLEAMLDLLDIGCCSSPNQDPDDCWRLVLRLCHAFQSYYGAGSPWSQAGTHDRTCLQAKLGLVVITQRLLQSLLEDRLRLPAPQEL